MATKMIAASVSALCDAAVLCVESGVRHLCLDLRDVTFCDSGSLFMLLGLQRALHAADGDLVVTAISNSVERALVAHGLKDLLRR
ncbi:predicted protein [Streptomyces iranensis]|uniref:STAS domain-containing protein n=3 Tax=Streptomyces TaxID=1883 RepID=A0A7X5X6Y8_STRMQ|nr:stage II sporulation protein AA (anti-sigma F factor antagonist) [Streptomyces iranensis]NIY67015.1 hypothetical protein [Streptomyces malaysiensis]CDR08169.1 predicted protein [Streptomyces iranensis]